MFPKLSDIFRTYSGPERRKFEPERHYDNQGVDEHARRAYRNRFSGTAEITAIGKMSAELRKQFLNLINLMQAWEVRGDSPEIAQIKGSIELDHTRACEAYKCCGLVTPSGDPHPGNAPIPSFSNILAQEFGPEKLTLANTLLRPGRKSLILVPICEDATKSWHTLMRGLLDMPSNEVRNKLFKLWRNPGVGRTAAPLIDKMSHSMFQRIRMEGFSANDEEFDENELQKHPIIGWQAFIGETGRYAPPLDNSLTQLDQNLTVENCLHAHTDRKKQSSYLRGTNRVLWTAHLLQALFNCDLTSYATTLLDDENIESRIVRTCQTKSHIQWGGIYIEATSSAIQDIALRLWIGGENTFSS